MTEHDERNPVRDYAELGRRETGDRDSQAVEPEGGNPQAPAPELVAFDLLDAVRTLWNERRL